MFASVENRFGFAQLRVNDNGKSVVIAKMKCSYAANEIAKLLNENAVKYNEQLITLA